ncbi:hypothetical protein HZC30_02015 [Candidatus Woesearchaeota archaeon]|nr:hypothetical protein [Candidatus Woesearchaeota archaeon]
MAKNIAWIDESPLWTEAYLLEMELNRPGIKFILHRTADVALQDLAAKHYDLIVVEPFLASGLEHPNRGSGNYDVTYYGVDLVKRIRAQEGPNQNTPIIAIYSRPKDELTQRLKDAGANEVVDTLKCSPGKFYEVVKEYLK